MWGFVSSIGSSILDFGKSAISTAVDWGTKAASAAWDVVSGDAASGILKDAAGAALGAAASYGAASLFAGGNAGSSQAYTPPPIAEIPAMPKSVMETGRGTEASKAVQQAEQRARAALAARKGRSSTILTGPTGLEEEDEAPTTRKQLLGV